MSNQPSTHSSIRIKKGTKGSSSSSSQLYSNTNSSGTNITRHANRSTAGLTSTPKKSQSELNPSRTPSSSHRSTRKTQQLDTHEEASKLTSANDASTSPTTAFSSLEGTGLPLKKVRKKDAIETLISNPPMIVKSELLQLRYLVLMEGLKVPKGSEDGICSYRPYVWSVLLRVSPNDIPYTRYLELVARGPHTVYSKIRNDTFRTFTTDAMFRKRVSEDALIRVLNSFAWQKTLDQQQLQQLQAHSRSTNHHSNANLGMMNVPNIPRSSKKRSSDTSDVLRRTSIAMANSEATGITPGEHAAMQSALELRNKEFLYIQGMNVLAAPFLYQCKSEAQAFALFYTFLTRDCPLYVIPTLDGAHYGIKLVDLCLEVIDPTLFEYLKSKFLIAELYAFTSVLTFSAGTPPLSEALNIWDALFAYGPHLNILFVIAQLTLMRNQLLESSSPMSLLRSFPKLAAREIIKLGVSFIPLLPDHLYDLLVRHPYDSTVGQEIERYHSGSQNSPSSIPSPLGNNSIASGLRKQRSMRPLNR